MTNIATSKTIQELKNLSADQSVAPHIPREGMMGKASNGSWYNLAVNTDGSLTGGLGVPAHDYISLSQAATTDTWAFKTGGSSGTTIATVVITYTDSNKTTISTVEKS